MVKELPEVENPFPNGYVDTEFEDKLFKHVLFHTQKNLSKFRIRSIGHDWTELLEAQTGSVQIPLTSWDFTKDKFRIKAVLSEPDYGVLESDWVSQQVLGEMRKRKLNQFRVRGISKAGLRSKWVYSELKDDENDLVVFQLLHDILDIMTVAHEHDFTAIIEKDLTDTLIGLMNGSRMDDVKYINTLNLDDEEFKYKLQESVLATGMGSHQFDLFKNAGISEQIFNEVMRGYMEHKEKQTVKIQEAAELVARHFKKNFMEQKKFSASDIVIHAKLYDLKDVRQSDVLDHMLEHILLLTVEDSYEKAIEEANLIALLQNDEEILSLLTDVYKFEAQSTLIELFNNVEFIDNFVSFFGDGLSLLLESHIDEAKVSQIKEDAIPTLLLMYKEIYIPLTYLDSTMADLFADLEDDATDIHKKISSYFNSVKFEYFDEDSGETWTLFEEYLFEIFEYLLMTDDHMEKQIDIDVFSKMIGYLKKDSIRMFITYDPVEAIEFIAEIVENIKISSLKTKDKNTEEYHLHLFDKVSTQDLIEDRPIEDAQKLQNKEDVLLTDTNIYVNSGEATPLYRKETYELYLGNFKRIIENYSLLLKEGYTIEDILSNKDLFLKYNLLVLDEANMMNTISEAKCVVSHYIAILHTLMLNDTIEDFSMDYRIPAYAVYHLDLLYKHNLTDLFTGPFVRRQSEEEFELANMFPTFYRFDDYFNIMWNLKEDIHVHLGDLDLTGALFPLGYFVLGTNTLEGEGNQL